MDKDSMGKTLGDLSEAGLAGTRHAGGHAVLDAQTRRADLLQMTAGVVSAYVGNNTVAKADISDMIGDVFTKFASLSQSPPRTPSRPLRPKASVSVRNSITPDYLICLEDGRKLKMLKRHLRTAYDMTPEQYRAKWGLPPDYPMVAPNYAAQRSEFARQNGLGKTTGRGGR